MSLCWVIFLTFADKKARKYKAKLAGKYIWKRNMKSFSSKTSFSNIYTYRSAETLLTKTKTARKLLDNETWDFSATWSEPRHKLNPFHADFPFTSVFFHFCIWSTITDVSCKMMSNILQHPYITSSTYPLRTTTAETSWGNSLFLVFTSGIPIPSRSKYIYIYIYIYI